LTFLEAFTMAAVAQLMAKEEPSPTTRGLARKSLEAFQTLGGRRADLKEEPEQAELKKTA
jgi:hypothetical protein